jgi:hypothetical protein
LSITISKREGEGGERREGDERGGEKREKREKREACEERGERRVKRVKRERRERAIQCLFGRDPFRGIIFTCFVNRDWEERWREEREI